MRTSTIHPSKEMKQLSACCNVGFYYAPPSVGEKGFYFCSNCKKTLDPKVNIITVPVYEQISNGVYRKIKY